MLDHYDYVAKLVGIEHLGMGSDIDLHDDNALPGRNLRNIALEERLAKASVKNWTATGLTLPSVLSTLPKA